MTAMVFWPDCRRTSMTTARSPSRNAAVRASSCVSLTSATSDDADRRAALGGDDDPAELLDPLEPPGRPQHDLGVPLIDASARDLDVLGGDRVADLAGAQPVG